MDIITLLENLLTTSGSSILLHGAISLPDATSCEERTSIFTAVQKFIAIKSRFKQVLFQWLEPS